MENNGCVTQTKAIAITDSILLKMAIDKEYPWDDWWRRFVEPNDEEPFMTLNDHRHQVKELINREFEARNKSNRLFVNHNKGIFMLDGESAVAARFFLNRVKKTASATKTTIERCHELAFAEGLSIDDSRMLANASKTIDGNLTTLAGAIARMRSIPKEVKRSALAHLGAFID